MLNAEFKFRTIDEIVALIWALEWAYDNEADLLVNARPEDLSVQDAVASHKRLMNVRGVLMRLSAKHLPEPKLPKHAIASLG